MHNKKTSISVCMPGVLGFWGSSPGFHLKTKPTCKQKEENGYKWNNMEKSVREFYFNCEVCQQINQKQKKNAAVYHIPSSRPKERCVIDVVYLSYFLQTKIDI